MPPRIRRRITSAKREQIEKEQEQLSNAIVRPFEILSGLPVSFNQPPSGNYEDVLKNPLTIKDTGVLYRSLMKSRFTYVHICPLFKLYWVKQSSYAKKLAEQDKPLPKSSKEDHFADRKPVLGYDVSARDVMVKLCDAKMTLGPHLFEIRLFIAKDGRSERPKKETRDNHDMQTNQPNIESNHKPNTQNSNQISNQNSNSQGKDNLPTTQQSIKPEAPQEVPKDLPRTALARDVDTSKNDENKPTKEPVESAAKPAPDSKRPSESPSEPTPPKNDPNNMQSIDNTIMISNLNAIARSDESLNKLMKIVALGSATPQQIITFQGYIKRAREMGPQPHHAYLYNNIPGGIPKKKFPKDKIKSKKEKKDKVPRDQKLTAFQERYLNDAMLLFEYVENPNVRFILPQEAICEVLDPEFPEENDDEENDDKDILVSFLWIHNQSEIDKYDKELAEYKRKIQEKEDEEKRLEEEKQKQESKKLEEEKGQSESINEENKEKCEEASVITEQNKDETKDETMDETKEEANEETKNETENVSKEESKEDTNEETEKVEEAVTEDPKENNSNEHIQEDNIESGETEVTEEVATEELSIEVKEEGITPEQSITKRLPPSRKLRNKKRRPPPRKAAAPKKLEAPVEPEIKFTAVSYTIHGIPSRFVPILVNSVKPLEKVQERMTNILKNGSRVPNFYLWYQVDGKLDESLAEDIRVQLNQEEKKMTGIQATSSEKSNKEKELAKKRKLKEKGEPKTKKVKVEDEFKPQDAERTQNIDPQIERAPLNASITVPQLSGTGASIGATPTATKAP